MIELAYIRIYIKSTATPLSIALVRFLLIYIDDTKKLFALNKIYFPVELQFLILIKKKTSTIIGGIQMRIYFFIRFQSNL